MLFSWLPKGSSPSSNNLPHISPSLFILRGDSSLYCLLIGDSGMNNLIFTIIGDSGIYFSIDGDSLIKK